MTRAAEDHFRYVGIWAMARSCSASLARVDVEIFLLRNPRTVIAPVLAVIAAA